MSISFGSTLPQAAAPARTTAQRAQNFAITGAKASADAARTIGICLTGADIGPGMTFLKSLGELGGHLLRSVFKKAAG